MKRALVSTSDKTGLIEFLKPLVEKGLEVVSTGGTLAYLKENNISAVDVSTVTQFPEVLDGRVKTLHPFVHMGLLADLRRPEHVDQLTTHQVKPFDLVIGNLYPFEETALAENKSFNDLIEKIDVGGPSFLRASAKNFPSVLVLCDPIDYSVMQDKILKNEITLEDRKKMALKVFSLTAYYDSLIVSKLSEGIEISTEYLNLPLKKKMNLRYGENSHQQASWFYNPLVASNLSKAEIHQGKELSYNNLLDLDAAVGLARLFQEPCCVAVKHNNPCGASIGKTLDEAATKAIESDSKSVFGGILAFNRNVDVNVVGAIKDIFLECLIAPSYSPEALVALSKKKNLRVLSWPQMQKNSEVYQYRSIAGGILRQSVDSFAKDSSSWSIYGKNPTDAQRSDIIFGEKICGFLKSNAIAIVYQGQTMGLGMGQVNRVDAVQQAILRFEEFKSKNSKDYSGAILVSDAFFPFADSVDLIAKAGIQWIVQPGGSTRDEEVIAAVENKKINMILTHQRHFRH